MAGVGLVPACLFFMHMNSELAFVITLAAFATVDIAFSIWNASITSILMRMTNGNNGGKIIGAKDAAASVGLLCGSLLVGEFTAPLGYPMIFSLRVAVLGVSFLLFRSVSPSARHKPVLQDVRNRQI